MNLVEEAKMVGAAMAHENANWDEGTRLAGLFFRGRVPWNPYVGFGFLMMNEEGKRALQRWEEFRAAEAAFFDAYYRR